LNLTKTKYQQGQPIPPGVCGLRCPLPGCTQVFLSRSALNTHRRKPHLKNPPGTVNDESFKSDKTLKDGESLQADESLQDPSLQIKKAWSVEDFDSADANGPSNSTSGILGTTLQVLEEWEIELDDVLPQAPVDTQANGDAAPNDDADTSDDAIFAAGLQEMTWLQGIDKDLLSLWDKETHTGMDGMQPPYPAPPTMARASSASSVTPTPFLSNA
jgi:hypothetical protein